MLTSAVLTEDVLFALLVVFGVFCTSLVIGGTLLIGPASVLPASTGDQPAQQRPSRSSRGTRTAFLDAPGYGDPDDVVPHAVAPQ